MQVLQAVTVAVMTNSGPAYRHVPIVIDTLEVLGVD